MYELFPLFRKRSASVSLEDAELESAPVHYLEGVFDGVIYVSVPPTTSAASSEKLREIIRVAHGEKKVVVVLTHNIELLKAQKMNSSKAARILKRVEGAVTGDADDFDKMRAVYDQVTTVLDQFARDLALIRDGEKPTWSADKMAEWAPEFLQSLARVVQPDLDEAEEVVS